MTAPWSITGADVLSQVRYIVWEFEGAKTGHYPHVSPYDLGGRTLSGLTWKTYSEEYLRLPKGQLCPQADFDALTLDDVVDVVLELFALRTNIHRIADPRLRFAVLDFAINAGADDAIPALQRGLGIEADGIFGRDTEAALTHHADPEQVREWVLDERYQKAGRLVVKRPAQLANLNGWLTRFGKALRWRPVVALLALLLASGCASKKPFFVGYGHPSPEEIDALLKAPLPPGKHAPARATAFEVSLSPTAFAMAGGSIWIRCVVPERYGAGVLRFGVEGVRTHEGPIEHSENLLFVHTVPCPRFVAFCALRTAAGVDRRERSIEPIGCEGGLS